MPALEATSLIQNAYVTIGNARNTAEILGCSHTAVLDAVRRSPDELASAKKTMAAKCLVRAEDAIESAFSGKYGDYKSKAEAVVSGAVLVDKACQLTSGPMVPVQINVIAESMSVLQGLSDSLAGVQSPSGDKPQS